LQSDAKSGRIKQDADGDAEWITINGAHIPISESGELQGTVGKKIEKETGENGSSEVSGNTGLAEGTRTGEPANARASGVVSQGLGNVPATNNGGSSANGGGVAPDWSGAAGNNEPPSRSRLAETHSVEADEFSKRMDIALSQMDRSTASKVDAHKPEEWIAMGAKMFSGEGKSADGKDSFYGSAVKPNGDIVGVFSGSKGGSKPAMIAAIANGGNKLDAYAVDIDTGEPGNLAHIYHKTGFIPVARVKFNPEYAEPDIVPQDIVFYKHNGDSAEQVAQRYGTYPAPTKAQYDALPVMDYDDATAFRDRQME
jgi:hypothetical protein